MLNFHGEISSTVSMVKYTYGFDLYYRLFITTLALKHANEIVAMNTTMLLGTKAAI